MGTKAVREPLDAAGADEERSLSPCGLDAWRALLFAHARLTRELDAELQERERMTLGDYDVLVQLAESPTGCLRMNELAELVVLSPSGLSRRVDRLEQLGLVQRSRNEQDARGIEASLTARGKRVFQRLRRTHRAGVQRRFASAFSEEELSVLASLLGRLADR
jgi:DNA-binding MarR family transcriptional regulator